MTSFKSPKQRRKVMALLGKMSSGQSTQKFSDQNLYDQARKAGESLYGENGTHGRNFSFDKKFVVKRNVSKTQFNKETLENESYELHTFDPFTGRALWTNAKPLSKTGKKFGDSEMIPAKDGKIYIADQNWGKPPKYDSKTIIYVIDPKKK